jgi:hypothetical protein
MKQGEFLSVRQAAIVAGIVKVEGREEIQSLALLKSPLRL